MGHAKMMSDNISLSVKMSDKIGNMLPASVGLQCGYAVSAEE